MLLRARKHVYRACISRVCARSGLHKRQFTTSFASGVEDSSSWRRSDVRSTHHHHHHHRHAPPYHHANLGAYQRRSSFMSAQRGNHHFPTRLSFSTLPTDDHHVEDTVVKDDTRSIIDDQDDDDKTKSLKLLDDIHKYELRDPVITSLPPEEGEDHHPTGQERATDKGSTIMTSIQREVPILIQDYLLSTATDTGDSRHDERKRWNSLSSRYRRELQWISSSRRTSLQRQVGNQLATVVGATTTSATKECKADSGIVDVGSTSTATATLMTPTGLVLDSSLALLRVTSQRDWARVDGESLLLGKKVDEGGDDEHDSDALLQFERDVDDDLDELSSRNDCLDIVIGQSSSDLFQNDRGGEGLVSDEENTALSQEEDDDSMELFWVLRRMKAGGVVLDSTEDYNLVLARIALSPELDHDDILEALLDTIQQLKAASERSKPSSSLRPMSSSDMLGPNATTYEILLLILHKRLGASRIALEVVRRDMAKVSHLLNKRSLEAAMIVCQANGQLSLARELWKTAQPNGDVQTYEDQFKISNLARHCMLNMLKAADAQDEALEVLREACLESDQKVNRGLDHVFVNAVQWPSRNRKKGPLFNLPVLISILDLLDEEENFYSPGLPVYTQLLMLLAKGAKPDDQTRWKVVQRVFRKMTASIQTFPINDSIFNLGLKASESLGDSALAADLITQRVEDEFGGGVGIQEPSFADAWLSDEQQKEQSLGAHGFLLSKSLLKSMDLAANCGDAINARRIVDCVEAHSHTAQFPAALRQRLFVSTIKAFGCMGDGQAAESMLSGMLSSGLKPTEEGFGAVIHGYTTGNAPGKAQDFLDGMQSGRFGEDVAPGPTSYNAIILSCIQKKAWLDALSIYQKMKKNGVVPMPSTHAGALLSSFKIGGRAGLMVEVDDLVQTKVRVNSETCSMAIRLALPALAKIASLDEMRSRLRSMGEEDPSCNEGCLSLHRALRIADLEEQREPTAGLSKGRLVERRDVAWREVLNQLLALRPNAEESNGTSFRQNM